MIVYFNTHLFDKAGQYIINHKWKKNKLFLYVTYWFKVQLINVWEYVYIDLFIWIKEVYFYMKFHFKNIFQIILIFVYNIFLYRIEHLCNYIYSWVDLLELLHSGLELFLLQIFELISLNHAFWNLLVTI